MKHDITVDLTTQQVKELHPLLFKIAERNIKHPGEPGSIFAQVWLSPIHGEIRAKYLTHEQAKKIHNVLLNFEQD